MACLQGQAGEAPEPGGGGGGHAGARHGGRASDRRRQGRAGTRLRGWLPVLRHVDRKFERLTNA